MIFLTPLDEMGSALATILRAALVRGVGRLISRALRAAANGIALLADLLDAKKKTA